MKVDEMSLKKEFSPFGEIEHITTFPGRTYAFVQFRSVVAACRAKEALQGKLFSNPRVNICFSKSEVGPLEHGRNSTNGTLPFSHKVTISSGIGSKVVENLRQERSHGITHGALGMPSPSFSSNLERMHSGSNVNLLGRANSMKTISGGYDDIRATRLGSDLGATKEVSELSVNILRHNLGMSLVPSVTELIMAELLYLQYDDPEKPIYMYINSTGTTKVSLLFLQTYHNLFLS